MSRRVETHFEIEQGDTLDLVVGPVVLPNLVTGGTSPIDLTAAGMKIRFTAKAVKGTADADAELRKTHGVVGGPGGITVNSPASAEKNFATIRAEAAETDALAVPAAGRLRLFYDVQLEEPDGRVTTLKRGTIVVVPDITDGT